MVPNEIERNVPGASARSELQIGWRGGAASRLRDGGKRTIQQQDRNDEEPNSHVHATTVVSSKQRRNQCTLRDQCAMTLLDARCWIPQIIGVIKGIRLRHPQRSAVQSDGVRAARVCGKARHHYAVDLSAHTVERDDRVVVNSSDSGSTRFPRTVSFEVEGLVISCL